MNMNPIKENTSINFDISASGHQIITVKINNYPLRFILDTAAGSSVLDRACLSRLGISEVLSDENAAGLGTKDHAMGAIDVEAIQIGNTYFKSPAFISLDLDHVQVAGGEEGVHGLIGAPFFMQYDAVIDFSNNTLVLSNESYSQ